MVRRVLRFFPEGLIRSTKTDIGPKYSQRALMRKTKEYARAIGRGKRLGEKNPIVTHADAKKAIVRTDIFILNRLQGSRKNLNAAIKIVRENPELIFLTKTSGARISADMAKSVLDTVFSIGREYTENARFAGKAEAAFRVLFQRDKKVSAEEFDAIKNQCLHKYAGGSFNIGPKEIEAIKTIYSLRMEQLLGSSYSTFVKTSQAAQPQLQKALMPKKRK